jgi:hypothetical protein
MVDLTGDGPAGGRVRPGRDASPAFDVFLPRHRSQGPAQPSGQGAGEPAIRVGSSYLASPAATPTTPAATPVTPAASPAPDPVSVPPWELSGQTGPLPFVPGDHEPAPPGPGDVHGLPRRVRQASLAPQLRADPPPRRRVTLASSGPAAERTPADIRRSMSALQHGWQEGRAQPAGTGEDRERASDADADGNTDGT